MASLLEKTAFSYFVIFPERSVMDLYRFFSYTGLKKAQVNGPSFNGRGLNRAARVGYKETVQAWCERGDSNPYTRRYRILKTACPENLC